MNYYIDESGKVIDKFGADLRLKIGKLSQDEFATYRLATDEEVKLILNPPKSDDELLLEQAKTEHAWVISELNNIQVELMYHWTGDTSRAIATEQEWKDYAIALRNYTTTDNNGNPILNNSTRPESPRK